jgi:hypothetical protein
MHRRLFPSLLLALPLTLFLGGCEESPSVERVRLEIERRVPEARFERDEHFRLGRVSFGLLKTLVRLVPGKVEGQDFLSAVNRIEVSTYRVSALPEDVDFAALDDSRFESRLAEAGWDLFLRSREKDGQVWMFVRSDRRGVLRNLFLVDLEGSELTLMRLDGRLDPVFVESVGKDPQKVVKAVREEERAQKTTEPEEAEAPETILQ